MRTCIRQRVKECIQHAKRAQQRRGRDQQVAVRMGGRLLQRGAQLGRELRRGRGRGGEVG